MTSQNRILFFQSLLAATLIHPFYSLAGFDGKIGETTLIGVKTVKVKFIRTQKFDWKVEKSTPPMQTPYVIPIGQAATANFTVTATRSEGRISYSHGSVSGAICVENTGLSPTIGLTLEDIIQPLGSVGYQDIISHFTLVNGELVPGEKRCFPFSVNADLDPKQSYQSLTWVNIRNLRSGGLGILLDALVQVERESRHIDETATLTDQFQCPVGFKCSPPTWVETLSDSKTFLYQITLENRSVPCGPLFSAINTATIVGDTSSRAETASATIEISPGACPI